MFKRALCFKKGNEKVNDSVNIFFLMFIDKLMMINDKSENKLIKISIHNYQVVLKFSRLRLRAFVVVYLQKIFHSPQQTMYHLNKESQFNLN